MLTEFICPDRVRINIEDCMKECRLKDQLECGRCLSKRTLIAVSQQRPESFGFSTTQLLRGTRQAYLKYRVDYAMCPQDGVYALHGTRVHDTLDKHTPADSLSEIRLSDENCSGAFDNYEDETLYDVKTYGSYQVAKCLGLIPVMIPDGVYKRASGNNKAGDPKFKKEYILGGRKNRLDLAKQLNDYRMKLEAHNYSVKQMVTEVIVRDGNTHIAKSRGVDQKAYLIKVNKISDSWMSKYMARKAKDLKEALETNVIPKVCRPKERWYDSKTGKSMMCVSYCDVAHACDYGCLQRELFGEVED